MKLRCLYVVIMTLFALVANAEIIRLGDFTETDGQLSDEELKPVFNMSVSDDSLSVTFSLCIPAVQVDQDTILYPKSYWWHLNGFWPSAEAGTASLPQRTLVFHIPTDAAHISLQRNWARWKNIEGIAPTPARELLTDSQESEYTLESVPPISKFDDESDKEAVSLEVVGNTFGYKLVYAHITPFKYYRNGDSVSACYDFSYTLSFDRVSESTDSETLVRLNDTEDLSLQNGIGVSGMPFAPKKLANYLVITTPNNKENFQYYFCRWKKRMGHDVRIMTRNVWTVQQIKDSIAAAYADDNNLRYVILGGAYKYIPAPYSKTYDNDSVRCRTDYEYGCIGNDTERTLYTGRILLNHDQELPGILNKISGFYTKMSDEPDYYTNATHIAYYQSKSAPYDSEERMFVKTSEDIRNLVMANGKSVDRIYDKYYRATPKYWNARTGYKQLLPDDLMPPNFAWNGSANDIVDKLNEGRFYALYRGHGASNAWGNPYFSTANISKLIRDCSPLVVFSMACATGNFEESDGLAVKLLASNGSSAVIAATADSYSYPNDAMALGIFKTIWPTPDIVTNTISGTPINLVSQGRHAIDSSIKEEWLTLGNILNTGEEYISSCFTARSQYFLKSHQELYHVYGDPGLYLNTEMPTEQTNVHFSYSPRDSSYKTFIVTITLDDDAIIGYWNETIDHVSRTYAKSTSWLVNRTDKFYITLLKHNKIPFTFEVDKGYIKASGAYIDDSHAIVQPAITSLKQVGSNAIDVTYSFGSNSESAGCEIASGTLVLTDCSNQVLATENVDAHSTSVTLFSPRIIPGLYVVSLQSSLGETQYKKIIIK